MFTPLDRISGHDRSLAGGKAYNCARLRQAGFPVPDGLVIPTDSAEAEIRRLADDAWLTGVPLDTLFAVRSSGIGEDSAGHSFAGIHETHLNVERGALVDAVLACRRSADSPAARAYRQARQLTDDDARIAVLVQRMVPAAVSGVAFTIHPISGAGELVINAARGLGDALVSGQIDPDEFRVSKTGRTVLSTRIGSSSANAGAGAALSPAQLAALAALLIRIERHYGAPQDVEWCHDGEQFWIVQSRPITTVPRMSHAEHHTSQFDPEWTRANLAEVLPDQVSPQAHDVYIGILNVGQRRFFGRLMAPESELGPLVKSFHGRLYFNLSQLRRVTAIAGSAFADTLRSLGHSEQIRPEDERATRPPLRDLLRVLPDLARIVYNDLRAEHIFRENQATVERTLTRLAAADPRRLSDDETWATLQWWLGIAPDVLTAVLVMGGVQFREDSVRKACRRVGFPYNELVFPHLAAGEPSVSTQQAIDLVALAASARREPVAVAYLLGNDGAFTDFRAALAGTSVLVQIDGFLERYGHRGRYESDWALPRLHENPASVLFAVRGQLHDEPPPAQARVDRQEAAAAAAWRAFESRLTWWQTVTLLPRVRATLRRLKQQYVWREGVRSDLTRVLSAIRRWHLALADRFVERGWLDRRDDYFLLRLDQIAPVIADPGLGPGLRALAARSAASLAAERDRRMPLFMRESELDGVLRAAHAGTPDAGGDLTGLCVSPGSVEAEVVVMRDPGEFASMKRGAILVAPATDPSWTPLFTLASGVIVEVGGMLSHASTIAREYGLPALANVKDATRLLKTGDRVRLDASGGRVVR